MFKPTVGLIAAMDGRFCRRCSSEDNLTVDHVVPVFHGGPDALSNCVILCRPCNLRKGSRIPSYADLPWERMLDQEADVMRQAMRRYLSWWTTLGAPRTILSFLSGEGAMPILASS